VNLVLEPFMDDLPTFEILAISSSEWELKKGEFEDRPMDTEGDIENGPTSNNGYQIPFEDL
jgi:hypothetical protein